MTLYTVPIIVAILQASFDKKHYQGSYSRFIVTDKHGILATSDFGGITEIAGVALVFEPIKNTIQPRKGNLIETLVRIFERDFKSSLAKHI